MQKKNKIFLLTGITSAAVILLLLGGFFWYLPYFWLDKLQNGYLLQHRNILRVQNVQAGAFNKYLLNDVQIGRPQKPLFSSARGELLLENGFLGKFAVLPVKKIILYDCVVKVDSSQSKIYLNGILLEEFVKKLTQLPASPNGKALELEIHSNFVIGKRPSSVKLQLNIISGNGKIDITGSWSDNKNKNIRGEWQAFIHPAENYFSFTISEHMTEIFMQELLLRSGVPGKAAAVLNQGTLYGEGSFSGEFNNWQIKELNYSGKVNDPVLSFYKYKTKNAKAFDIKLHKSPRGMICKIPELSLDNKKSSMLKNINIKSAKILSFNAECDFQQLAADHFFRQSRIAVRTNAVGVEELNGVWDTSTDTWSFSKKTSKAHPRLLRLETDHASIVLLPEKFDFHATGQASAGTVTQQIKFKDLEFYSADNQKKMQSKQGVLNTKSIWGYPRRQDQHILGGRLKDISAVTAWGIVELPEVSATIELGKTPNDLLDIFVSLNGAEGKAVNKNNLFSATDWRGFFRLYANNKKSVYQLKNMDFRCDCLKLEIASKVYTVPDFHLQLQGILEQNKLTSASVAADAGRIIADKLDSSGVKLVADFDCKRPEQQKLQGFLTCKQGVFPHSANWYISKIVDAKLDFSGPHWKKPMEKFSFNAHLLDWQKDDFSGTFQNSKWQIMRKNDKTWDCIADSDFMKLASFDQRFGKGQFGKSSLSLNIQKNADGKMKKLTMLGIMHQISWLKGDYHIGSDNVQCQIQIDKSSTPLAKGKITMAQANILGRDIIASTPVLSVNFTASDVKNINGNIDFAPGSVSDTEGNIQLRKVKFSLPLYISTKNPDQAESGSITAEDIRYKQQHEGSFCGKIRHFMRLPASVTDTLLHQIEVNGELASDKFGGKAVSVAGTWQLPPEKNSIKWQFSMPERHLTQPLALSDYIDLPVQCTALKGSFTLDGTVKVSSNHFVESIIKLNSINADWQFGQITTEGLTGASVLNLFDNKVSLLPHEISVAKILSNDFLLKDNELTISLDTSKKLQISNWHGSLLGGKYRSVQMPVIDLNKRDMISAAKFTLEDIPLTPFFNIFGIKCFISDALLNGDIQLNTQSGKLFVDKSLLSFKSPTGKVLQLKLKDPAAIKMRDLQFRDFTLAILNAMKCYQANFNFSTSPEEIVMQLKAEGTPAEPVPFVYQGRSGSSPFRPAEPGEAGFSGEIELNVNLKLHPGPPGA